MGEEKFWSYPVVDSGIAIPVGDRLTDGGNKSICERTAHF